ncbi:MAG: MarR family transcriptional regulator [Rhodospirillaceae bacterium]|nr:MarR family transcriptional regulator [Rhodospirillaceae bacterium]|tara:strand:- start:14429 stop:15073 length:645 start_codon:yes stop_codon:yes gene_type:complete
MTDSNQSSQERSNDAEITLNLLSAVEQKSNHTQRSIANETGIALGLANAYIKRCIKKGWIKATQIPANRYAYYLTPKGFAEKSRLTSNYLSSSFDFFRSARSQCSSAYSSCENNRWRRIALAGASDLAEIAVLCSHDYSIELIGIVDPSINRSTFAGVSASNMLKEFGTVDAVLVTELKEPQQAFDTLAALMPAERILTPTLLKISRKKPKLVG